MPAFAAAYASTSVCYHQLRADFFGGADYYDEKAAAVATTGPVVGGNSSLTEHSFSHLLSLPAVQINRQVPKHYNFTYWSSIWPDPRNREAKVFEEIQRRYTVHERQSEGKFF